MPEEGERAVENVRKIQNVGRVLAVIWLVILVGVFASYMVAPIQAQVPESVAMALAAAWFGLVLYVMYACTSHLLHSDKYRGTGKFLWVVFMFAGHVVGCTIYYATVMRPGALQQHGQ